MEGISLSQAFSKYCFLNEFLYHDYVHEVHRIWAFVLILIADKGKIFTIDFNWCVHLVTPYNVRIDSHNLDYQSPCHLTTMDKSIVPIFPQSCVMVCISRDNWYVLLSTICTVKLDQIVESENRLDNLVMVVCIAQYNHAMYSWHPQEIFLWTCRTIHLVFTGFYWMG